MSGNTTRRCSFHMFSIDNDPYDTHVITERYLKYEKYKFYFHWYTTNVSRKCTPNFSIVQGVCQILHPEFPDFFLVFPDSPSTSFSFFYGNFHFKIRQFRKLLIFWYFFYNICSQKCFPDFLSKFPDFSKKNRIPWLPWLGRHPVS